MKAWALLVLAAVLLAGGAFAQDSGPPPAPRPEQFAWAIDLATAGDYPLFELELPEEVYRGVTRADLGDLRVFNADGQVVPHALRPPEGEDLEQERRLRDLPFFPVAAGTGAESGLRVQVDAARGGTIVSVSTAEGGAATAPATAWLVDATQLETPLELLEFAWVGSDQEFMGRMVVERSDDLVQWTPLTTAALARLHFQGERLERNRVSLGPVKVRYLRLSWHEPVAVGLGRVTALAREARQVRHPALRWNEFPLVPVAGSPGRYQLELPGFLPVELVRIILPERNLLASASLSSGRDPQTEGIRRWHGLVYALSVQGELLATPEVQLPRTAQRYWWLRFARSEAELSAPPTLAFGWRPDRLVFLARGEGPYRLAFGSAAVSPTTFQVDTLLRQAQPAWNGALAPRPAHPGVRYLLGGEERLRPGPEPWPWKKILLWCALGGGVVALGLMALSLRRQLRAGD